MDRIAKGIGTLGIPEVFYDTLAYVVPAAYLAIGLGFHQVVFHEALNVLGSYTGSWVFDCSIVLLFFGSLFVIGQMLTALSFYAIWQWPCKLAKTYFPIQEDYVFIKIKYPSMSLLITKRFAKCVCSRNLVMASLILALKYSIDGEWITTSFVAGIMVLFIFDTNIRRKWLREFMDRVKAVSLETDIGNSI